MSALAALTLLPLLTVTLAVGFTAMRFGRKTAVALELLCLVQAGWVAGLILLQSGVADWAERLLPSGMLLAGATVHTGRTIVPERLSRRIVAIAWVASAAIALLGLVAPRALYGPGAQGIGPLFPPLAVAAVIGTLATKWFLFTLVREATTPRERRRRVALLLSNVFGALGGGGAISLHITGLAPIGIAAPFMLASVLTVAYAVWASEDARGRDLLRQGWVQTAVTATLTAALAVPLVLCLPRLVPGGEVLSGIGLLVALLLLIPLEPLRHLIADRVLTSLFPDPIAVRELTQAVEREESRADHAERLAELGRVASAVAHEIRNPLGVILAETKLLERGGADPAGLAAIRAQVNRASGFVGELLRYARPRPLELAEVDVAAVLRNAAQAVTKAFDGSAARLALPQGVGPVIEADPRGLEDVVRNLVSNALIATRDHGDAQVRLLVSEDRDHVRIVVEDDGPGVPQEIRDRLFEPFVTGRGRDEAHPGTGLGLAISLRLAERHGARLFHETPSSGGARFVAHWPKRPISGGEKP